MNRYTTNILLATFLALGLVSCVDSETDRSQRYPAGSYAPCDTTIQSARLLGEVIHTAEFHEPGPLPVWNTHAADGCNQNFTIDHVGPHDDVEMYITYPADGVPTQTGNGAVALGRWPVVLFAHSNHDRECEVFESYYSLHDHWASWGFVVVSVDASHANCRPGTQDNIEIRKEGLLRALDRMADLTADPNNRFYGRIDTNRVFFAGHSRGGGAALLAADTHDFTRGAVALQAIDLTQFGFGTQKLKPFPVVAFTAGNDVDLNFPKVEPNEDQIEAEYTWVDIVGGIHAYTGDTIPLEHDDEPEISRAQNHDVTEYFSTAFLMRWARPWLLGPQTRDALFRLNGQYKVVEDISYMGAYTRWRDKATAIWVDRFDPEDTGLNELQGATTLVSGDWAKEAPTYRPSDDVESTIWDKSWSLWLGARETGVYRTELATDGSGLSVDGSWLLTFRVKGPDLGWTADLDVVLVDMDGREAAVSMSRYAGPLDVSNRFTQVVIPMTAFFDIDLNALNAIELRFSAGQLFVDDLRFSSL